MPGKVAELILSGKLPGGPQPPLGPEGGRTLVKVARIGPGGDAWHACLSDADTDSIIAAIGGLVSPVDPNEHIDAYREAARAMVEQKLADRMVAKMESLERASNRLGLIAIGVTVVIAAVELLGPK